MLERGVVQRHGLLQVLVLEDYRLHGIAHTLTIRSDNCRSVPNEGLIVLCRIDTLAIDSATFFSVETLIS